MEIDEAAMKKKLLVFLFFNIVVITSCQQNEGLIIRPTNTPAISYYVNKTPSESSMTMPTIAETKGNDTITDGRYTGRLFIGSYPNGNYQVFDFNQNTYEKKEIPLYCIILSKGSYAICKDKNQLFMWNIDTNEKINLPIKNVSDWRLTPDQGMIYSTSSDDNTQTFPMSVYEISEGKILPLPTVDLSKLLVLPYLSNNGDFLFGTKYVAPWKNYLVEIDKATGQLIDIYTPDDFWITYNISWSPNENLLAFTGTDMRTENANCSTYLMIYNAKSGEINKSKKLTTGQCYDDFELHSTNIWSPNGEKIALVEGNKICIINVKDLIPKCGNVADTKDKILKISWDPTSKFLAFTTREDRIVKILDTQGFQIDELPLEMSISDQLIWNVP